MGAESKSWEFDATDVGPGRQRQTRVGCPMIEAVVDHTIPRRLGPADVAEARDGLQRILEAIGRNELTASSAYVARLEGAISALSALLVDSPDLTA